VDLDYQGFGAELAALPGQYAPPLGELLLAKISGGVAGCVALRALDQSTLEMKRLYVRPAIRGAGLGKRLVEAAITIARKNGYTETAAGHAGDHGRGAGALQLIGLHRDCTLWKGIPSRHAVLCPAVGE
jgi:GNAT superfamily N-acetyltransferase